MLMAALNTTSSPNYKKNTHFMIVAKGQKNTCIYYNDQIFFYISYNNTMLGEQDQIAVVMATSTVFIND